MPLKVHIPLSFTLVIRAYALQQVHPFHSTAKAEAAVPECLLNLVDRILAPVIPKLLVERRGSPCESHILDGSYLYKNVLDGHTLAKSRSKVKGHRDIGSA